MTGETKHVYAINAKTPSSIENDTALGQFSKKDTDDNRTSRVPDSSGSAFIAEKASHLNGRERETHSQREAVIRPQQAGKIDFKSLQNRTKFSSNATWTNGKSSPPSPSGKSRGKDKNKRSGKGDRTQHQLYRLSISSSRSNPTIGIAYPQQKVTQPKKVEVSRGPVSGSYRFHVPSLPEREAELHQEDLNFNRSVPEPSPSLTSTNYTSQTASANRPHHGLKHQPGSLHDTANSNGQLHYLEFQANGNSWHPSEKHFTGTNGYAIPNQKLCSFPEGNKPDSHSFGPVSFQYPFPPLQEPNGNSFCNNGNSPEFDNVSLASSQVAHNAFSFPSSSREGPEDPQVNGPYNTVLQDSRTYGLPSQQAQFLHTPQGVQHPPTPPCYTGRNEPSADHNGAISSSGALTPSGAIEQSQSTFQEKQTVFNPNDFSLHKSSVRSLMSKRQQPDKNFVHSQRLLTPGNTLRRTIPQTALNKVHFSNKPYNNVNTGSVPFDKSLSRIPQAWDTGSNGFPPLDQNPLPYTNAPGNAVPYPCQPSDPRQALRNPRMPWQQGHLTSPTQNQNQLPRHNGNPKQPYNLNNSDWQNNNVMPKILPSYHAKKHLVVEGSSTQRSEMSRQSYNSPTDILYDSVKDTNSQLRESRTKGILYGMSQPIPQSRNNGNQSVPLSGKTFVAESPCESPLPSPVTNPVNGSTCSSLSPMSSSPMNPSSEESHLPPTLTSPPYFHQPFHQTDKSFPPNDPLNSSAFLYHSSEPTRNFTYMSDSSKDEQQFKNLPEKSYPKLPNEPTKESLENFESEPPPPYSSHHLLASSLSSANLDQLDVLLTCKQCDQNFGNLSSFLDHRQYCNLNSVLQNEMKDSLHGGDMRKSAAEPLKSSQTIPALSLHKGQTEFHPQLPGFNKEYLLDGDDKGEVKEDSLKCNTFHNVLPHLLPLTACDTLEMDDAKLDSLIIEALNGLEFQVENPEIDSTFIDVFDDDFTTAKVTGCSQANKVKELSTDIRKNARVEETHNQHYQVPYVHEPNCENGNTDNSYNHRNSIKTRNVSKAPEVGTARPYVVDNDTHIKQVTVTSSEDGELPEKKKTMLNKEDSGSLEDKDIKTFEFKQGKNANDFSITGSTKPRRATLKDNKKKKSHNGTWSKELIQKIVQQKNKLHKLHVKSNKDVEFSLVTERLYPTNKNHPFGEYDYISDSDEEVAANVLPSKTQPNGRLKYSFNREVPGRGGRTKSKEPIWRMGEATRFQLPSKDLRCTNKDLSTRMRRRSSQSSNSSDQSTSMSSEIGSSPKSTERTDSENEQEILRCKSFNTRHQNTTFIKPLYRENISENPQRITDYSKGTKRFGSAKFLLASSKVYPSINAEAQYKEKDTFKQSVDLGEHNISKLTEVHPIEEGSEKRLSTYQDEITASTLMQDKYSSTGILDINNVPNNLSPFHADDTNYQKKQLSSSSIPSIVNTEANSSDNISNVSEDLCYNHKDFTLPIPCFSDLQQQSQKEFVNECQTFPEDKHVPSLYDNNLFAKTQITAAIDTEQIYTNQSNGKPIDSFEHKCPDPSSYSSDKISSAFSFDSSSMFAELPLSDFESPVYNNVTPTKENFMEFHQSNKPNSFQHQFPQYLPEKSWDVVGENAPVLSATINSLSAIDSQSTEKYTEHVAIPSDQVAGDLPRNIADYNPSFINNISEDELEIKRLVTELENQLQTSKAPSDMSSQTIAKHNVASNQISSSITFPEMEVNKLENSINNSYLNDNHINLKDMESLVLPSHVDCNIHDSQPLVKDIASENLKSPWTCPVEFDTLTSDTLTSFTTPEDNNQFESALHDACVTEELGSMSNSHSPSSTISDALLPNLTNEMECQTFADHELLATTDKLISKTQENNDVPEKERQQNDNENLKINQQKMKEQFDDPPELEHFPSVCESEFGFKHANAPFLNNTVTPDNNVRTSELIQAVQHNTFSVPQVASGTDHTNSPVLSDNQDALEKNTNTRSIVLLDMPVLEKEESVISEKSAKDATENPLQQLQLFVARTAKSNEEEMLMPCFPIILAASGTAETERDASHVTETSKVESENNLKMAEIKETVQLSESGIQLPQSHQVSKQTENECSSLNIINTCVHGMIDGDGENVLQGQAKVNEEICQEENDGKKLSSVTKTQKSSWSNHIFNKDKYSAESVIAPMTLGVLETTFDRPDAECLLPNALNIEVAQHSEDGCHKADDGLHKGVSVFVCPENNRQDINMHEETEILLGNNTSQEKGQSSIMKLVDTSQIHNGDIQHCSNDKYVAQLHGISLSTEHSLLSFDLLSDIPNKESIPQQKLSYTSQEELNLNVENPFPRETASLSEQEVVTNPVGTTDILFMSNDNTMASSEAGQPLITSKDAITMTPVVEDGLSPCYCTDLVCSHFKPRQVQSVADIILGCQTMPTDDTYPPIYAGESNPNFTSIHNELFPESMQTSVGPLLCHQKEETLKNDWNNTQSINHVYPTENNGSSAMVCDLMDIAPPEFVNFNCHQATENTAVGLIPEMNNLSEADGNISNCDSEKKGTNDMHSVIDGVLRILEGDKSKEILQSIGITPKSSPIKEKKVAGPSLTCDICSVTFRSKPGLMRHKAVKHNSSPSLPKDTTNEKTLASVNKIGVEWSSNSDSLQSLQSDTASQNIIVDFINQTNSLQPNKEPSKAKGEKNINGLSEGAVYADLTGKKKIKAKKRKVKPLNNKCTDSQVPPDEVLNILKTNILKAIGQSNNFNTADVKTGPEKPSDSNISEKESNVEEVKVKTCTSLSIDDDDDKLVSDVLDMEMNRESFIQDQTWGHNLKEHVEHITDNFEDRPMKSMLMNDQNLMAGTVQHLNVVKNVNVHNEGHASNLPKETVTDLHSFFDDENTFSQLFPGDDHFIRRKCTRVYGKKTRRQTPPFETDFRHLDMSDHSHSAVLNYACDYRNISGDSLSIDTGNSTGQTDHLALYKHSSPPKEDMDIESKMLSFVQQNQLENMTEPSFSERHSVEEERGVSTHINLYQPPEESVDLSAGIASEIRECEIEEDLDCTTSNEPGLPEFPTIDMKMLSAKFDMRELSFFSACGDDSDQSDLDPTDIAQKEEKRKRHAKNKTDEKRQLKNRSNVKMKTKDKQYKCKVCFQWFLTLGELDFHKLTHNPSPPPTCYMCVQRKFSSREQLRDHLKEKHAKNKAGLWICGMCLKEISDVWMYNEHLREHATQFARKGQAQKSVIGIPGCFGEDSMVRTFLSTFIYRTPTKPSKNVETDEKSPVNKMQEQTEHKEEDEVVSEKEPDGGVHVMPPAPKSSMNQLEGCQKSETIHKNASMHPHCKDPSRDCHHCGKQFPKPFKLQRHLVVHSLQKIYLCHQCPKSYQEAQDLRSHLTNEHQLTEKSEIKHTTLYACELCADVMHVIKKSFICSTCNYTFSKKEQYDRHMEKHLIGGSMTFKFRGVTRPSMSAKERKEKLKDSPAYESFPPFKKPKLSSYSDITDDILDSIDTAECPKLSPGTLYDKEMEGNSTNEHENAVKIEEMFLDDPLPQTEGKEEPASCNTDICPLSPIVCELKVNERLEDELANETLPILNNVMMLSSPLCSENDVNFVVNDIKYSNITGTTTKQGELHMEEQPKIPVGDVRPNNDISHLHLHEPAGPFTFINVLSPCEDNVKESQCLLTEIIEETKEDTPKSQILEATQPAVKVTSTDKSLVTDTNSSARKKSKSSNQLNSKSTQGSSVPSNNDNVLKSSASKSKSACSHERESSNCTFKEATTSQLKLKKEPTAIVSKANADFKIGDKMLAPTASKLHPKKGKEHKLSSHKGNAGSQENQDGEKKRKRAKLSMTGKSESSATAKKTELVNNLSDNKDEVPGNRAYPKPNAGGATGHFRKTVLDTHNQKKVNSTSNNGEYRCKRALLTKSLHTFTPRNPALNGPPHKRRLGANAKPTEPSNYRTAESQNNLLSQLFGQKLTSFKIPLRRDTTE